MDIVLSFIGCIPAILPILFIRYGLTKQPLSPNYAFGISAGLWVVYFVILTNFNASPQITGPGATAIAFTAYYILHSGWKKPRVANPKEITFECPYCDDQITTTRQYAGSKGICPNCGKSVVVPDYQ